MMVCTSAEMLGLKVTETLIQFQRPFSGFSDRCKIEETNPLSGKAKKEVTVLG